MNFNPEGGAMQAIGSHSPSWVASIIPMMIARFMFFKILCNDL